MSHATGAHVVKAVSAMGEALEPHVHRDWRVPAGTLEWSCRATAVHIAHDLAACSAQLASGSSQRYLPVDLIVRSHASTSEVLEVVNAWGRVLGAVVDAADQGHHAWHFGRADRVAFAAMGIGEVLVHTRDIASGLEVDWRPPTEVAEVVVARLFPEAPDGEPVDVLLWATGRGVLGGHAPADKWVWNAAQE